MKYCDKCKVNIPQNISYCPLCQNVLIEKDDHYQEFFPKIENKKDVHLAIRILILISLVIASTCFLVNVTFPSHGWWSLFVLLGIASAWISATYAVKKRRNMIRAVFYQEILIGLLALIWDFCTKWRAWSINYVLPILWIVAMIGMAILYQVARPKKEDALYYFVMNSILGILSFLLIITGVLEFPYLVFTCVVISLIYLITLIVFYGKDLRIEFQKRFHV